MSNRAKQLSILLGTFNGARFLPQQLASVENQSFTDWHMVVSDDGSTDGTMLILEGFREKFGSNKVVLKRGPGKGFVKNFLSLACDPPLEAAFYAFSDQDDVWESGKLTRALQWLGQAPADVPALYCSRTRLIDESDRAIGFSPLFKKKPSFRNALVQSIAGGNTMVFNERARRLAILLGPDVSIPSHDWWFYLLVTGAGGWVHYDPAPTICYRVHHHNVIGSNVGWTAHNKRIRMLAKGRFKRWTDMNEVALSKFRPFMTDLNREIFDLFCNARHATFFARLVGIARSGVYRQTLLGNIGLTAAAILKKI